MGLFRPPTGGTDRLEEPLRRRVQRSGSRATVSETFACVMDSTRMTYPDARSV